MPLPTNKSLVRLKKDGKSGWYFISIKSDNTLKLRPVPQAVDDAQLDGIDWRKLEQEYEVLECHSPAEIERRLGVPKSDIAWKNCHILMSTVAKLESGTSVKTIPISEMRRFYEWLRDRPNGINKLTLHAALAQSFANTPRELSQSFLRSLTHFSGYSNIDEPFMPRENPLELPSVSTDRSTDQLVNCIVQNLHGHMQAVYPGIDCGCTAIARELGPMRSTQKTGPWRFEDNRSVEDSGAGGLDLLLASDDGKIPTICEIKIRDDQTPFYALIQSLAYAAELGTQNQYRRLRNAFPQPFGDLPDAPTLDIYILMKDSPPEHAEILQRTQTIVQRMYQEEPAFGATIRRVVFLTVAEENGELLFHVENVSP